MGAGPKIGIWCVYWGPPIYGSYHIGEGRNLRDRSGVLMEILHGLCKDSMGFLVWTRNLKFSFLTAISQFPILPKYLTTVRSLSQEGDYDLNPKPLS